MRALPPSSVLIAAFDRRIRVRLGERSGLDARKTRSRVRRATASKDTRRAILQRMLVRALKDGLIGRPPREREVLPLARYIATAAMTIAEGWDKSIREYAERPPEVVVVVNLRTGAALGAFLRGIALRTHRIEMPSWFVRVWTLPDFWHRPMFFLLGMLSSASSLSRAEIAARLHVNERAIARWKNGARPREEHLDAFADLLGKTTPKTPPNEARRRVRSFLFWAEVMRDLSKSLGPESAVDLVNGFVRIANLVAATPPPSAHPKSSAEGHACLLTDELIESVAAALDPPWAEAMRTLRHSPAECRAADKRREGF